MMDDGRKRLGTRGDMIPVKRNKTGEENEATVVQGQKNPSELPPVNLKFMTWLQPSIFIMEVIKCVLKYMNVKDLKKCRHISKMWSSMALSELKRRSKILFRRLDDDSSEHRTPAMFYKTFPNTCISTPFTAFQFENKLPFSSLSSPWTVKELNYFFQSYKHSLNEISFKYMCITDGSSTDSFDLTPCLSDSSMTNEKNKRDTKLSVIVQYTNILVSMSVLVYVKKLCLDWCSVVFEKGIKNSPIELRLRFVSFIKNGSTCKYFNVNEGFDFSRCKKLILENDNNRYRTLMNLDFNLTNVKALDYLCLDNIQVKNWRSFKCTIGKVILCDVPYIEATKMQVKEFHLYHSKIDISVLPESIETLAIDTFEDCFYSQKVNLPNLKYLSLYVKEHLYNMMPHFTNIPLVELDLTGDHYLSREISFFSIPKTLKRLNLSAVNVSIQDGDIPLNLDVLILENYSFSAQAKFLKILTGSLFKTKELIITDYTYSGVQVDLSFVQFLELDKKCLDFRQRFYIGAQYWNFFGTFENSLLSRFVDVQDYHYIFENGKGTPIDWGEFREHIFCGPCENGKGIFSENTDGRICYDYAMAGILDVQE